MYPQEPRESILVSQEPGLHLPDCYAEQQVRMVLARKPVLLKRRCALALVEIGEYEDRAVLGGSVQFSDSFPDVRVTPTCQRTLHTKTRLCFSQQPP